MRIAVMSDIHGNMDALEKVLEDIDRQRPEAVFSLGDTIGYGAEPERVVCTLSARGVLSVLGNHEKAINEPGFLGWFNAAARQSLDWTRTALSAESIDLIRELPAQRSAANCRFVHGFPPDSPTVYLFHADARRKLSALAAIPERFCFVGHTHVLALFASDGHALTEYECQEGAIRLDPEMKYLINIGAVGQPRDGDLRAKYVIWDDSLNQLEIRCVPYDAAAAAAKIRTAGLPEQHARRLTG